MHPDQQAFCQGFADWDAEAMATALVKILTLLRGQPISAEEMNDFTWSCREILETFGMCPRLGHILPTDATKTSFLVIDAQAQDLRGKGRYNHITIGLRLGKQGSAEVTEKWQQLGFTKDLMRIGRENFRVPDPLPSETGYERKIGKPSIHRRPGVLKAQKNQTYAHALASERSDGELLALYTGGGFASAWTRMVQSGESVRDDFPLSGAVAVARETMRRCRANVELLASRLHSMRYEFSSPEEIFVPPPTDVLDRIAIMEEKVGPLPLSLAAWCELVGSVNFTGDHPDWPQSETYPLPDPLVVGPVDFLLTYDEDQWRRHWYEAWIAPDEYHKADISGGPPYAILLPDAAADVPIQNEWHRTHFVSYLRHVFEFGGFPGWERLKDLSLRKDLVRELTADLLPI
jgi:hypothetical protein